MSDKQYVTTLRIDSDDSKIVESTKRLREMREEMAKIIGLQGQVGAIGGDGSGGGTGGDGSGGGAGGGSGGGSGGDASDSGGGGGGGGGGTPPNRRRGFRWPKQLPMPGAGMLMGAVAGIPIVGLAGRAAIMDVLQNVQKAGAIERAEAETRALTPGFTGADAHGLGVELGMAPADVEQIATTLAGSGLRGGILRSGGLLGEAMGLRRGMGIDAGTTAQFMGLFRTGGGARLAGDTDAERADYLRSSLGFAVGAAGEAGLEAADVPRYLRIIAEQTGRLADRGVDIDPAALVGAARAISAMSGHDGAFAGLRGLRAAAGIGDLAQTVAGGGGTALQQHMMLRAVGLGTVDGGRRVDLVEATRRLESFHSGTMSVEGIGRIRESFRRMPGGRGRILLVARALGMSIEQAEAFLGGGAIGFEDVADVGLSDAALGEARGRAHTATGPLMAHDARLARADVALGKSGAPIVIEMSEKVARPFREGAQTLGIAAMKKGLAIIDGARGLFFDDDDEPAAEPREPSSSRARRPRRRRATGGARSGSDTRIEIGLTPEAQRVLEVDVHDTAPGR